jgi:hypothetical protein
MITIVCMRSRMCMIVLFCLNCIALNWSLSSILALKSHLTIDLSLYNIRFNGSFNYSSLVVVDGSYMDFFPLSCK